MTARDEIQVPRELLEGMLTAQATDIIHCAWEIDGDFAGTLVEPNFSNERDALAAMLAAIDVRSALDRAAIHGAAVPLEVVRAYIDEAIAYYAPDDDGYALNDDGSSHGGHPQIHRDLIAWREANGLATAGAAS
jgi:hypothetical protein